LNLAVVFVAVVVDVIAFVVVDVSALPNVNVVVVDDEGGAETVSVEMLDNPI
jgi:hypothetical protein